MFILHCKFYFESFIFWNTQNLSNEVLLLIVLVHFFAFYNTENANDYYNPLEYPLYYYIVYILCDFIFKPYNSLFLTTKRFLYTGLHLSPSLLFLFSGRNKRKLEMSRMCSSKLCQHDWMWEMHNLVSLVRFGILVIWYYHIIIFNVSKEIRKCGKSSKECTHCNRWPYQSLKTREVTLLFVFLYDNMGCLSSRWPASTCKFSVS